MNTTEKKQAFFITINNPTGIEEDPIPAIIECYKEENIKFIKFAIETGEQEKTRHIHIYLRFRGQQRWSSIKKLFPRADIEEPIGAPQQIIEYIGNPDYTYSDKHANKELRGKKKGGTCEKKEQWGDLKGVVMNKKAATGKLDARLNYLKEAIDAGTTIEELYGLDFSIMIRYGDKLEKYLSLKKLPSIMESIKAKRELAENDRKRLLLEAEQTAREIVKSAMTEEF